MMTNKMHTVIYTGVTSDLLKRAFEHKEKFVGGFTNKYKVSKLVYYEVFQDIEYALQREKQIKGYLRQKKVHLIESTNKGWRDLYKVLLKDSVQKYA
jgi:putative endonuclease